MSFTEHSVSLNPHLKGRDIREAFKGGEYQVLLVANKFQTGFDQPLLCGIYVDRRLAGIQAVQTLSRMNRAYPGKDTTYVVDFVNEPADVLEAFRMYHTTAELSATTDPNLVFNLRAKLDAAGHYDDFEVDRVVEVELDPKSRQSDLVKALEPVVDRITRRFKAAQEALQAANAKDDAKGKQDAKAEIDALVLFKSDMGAYVRLYTFLSQIFDYGSTAIEKRAIFYKRLLPLLELGREREDIDLPSVQQAGTDHFHPRARHPGWPRRRARIHGSRQVCIGLAMLRCSGLDRARSTCAWGDQEGIRRAPPCPARAGAPRRASCRSRDVPRCLHSFGNSACRLSSSWGVSCRDPCMPACIPRELL